MRESRIVSVFTALATALYAIMMALSYPTHDSVSEKRQELELAKTIIRQQETDTE